MKRWMTVVATAGSVLASGAVHSAAHAEAPTPSNGTSRHAASKHAHPASAENVTSEAARRGGVAGPYYINGGKSTAGRSTPELGVRNAHVRICFNFWGLGTRKGFRVWLVRTGVHGLKTILWGASYWGPKNKTCSPWKAKNSGTVWAAMSARRNAYGEIWFHWY